VTVNDVQNGHKPKRPHDYGHRRRCEQIFSLNKLGIIKSRTETTGPVARRIQATGSNKEDAVRTQRATSAAQVDKERATMFIHTVGRA